MTAIMPLAARLRPRSLEEYVGQRHLLSPGKPLHRVLHSGHLHSMIFWGPPGTGKTTLAYLFASTIKAHVEKLSAVESGVKAIRDVVQRALQARDLQDQKTILFVDEIHRFNKSQQDAFLPYVEDGTLILIGATTENPSFQLNNALLSRCRVYVLKQLSTSELETLIDRAISDTEYGLAALALTLTDTARNALIAAADGDARQLLLLLEVAADLAVENTITVDTISELLVGKTRRFDHHGDAFYDQISALHKSVRGSSPDAALYWFGRMIDGGCDIAYIARRIVRMATEDIGNADPRALTLSLNAWEAYERMGSPEGELALAQAVIYLACAPKSNATYVAYSEAMRHIRSTGSLDVPLHLRNAPTSLMKELGHAKGYRYAHNEADAYAAGESYFPEEIDRDQCYYHPTARGLEIKITEKLNQLRKRDCDAAQKER